MAGHAVFYAFGLHPDDISGVPFTASAGVVVQALASGKVVTVVDSHLASVALLAHLDTLASAFPGQVVLD